MIRVLDTSDSKTAVSGPPKLQGYRGTPSKQWPTPFRPTTSSATKLPGMIPTVIITLIVVASIGVCYVVAKRRGANAGFWAVMGALFGPLAVPFVFLAKGTKRSKP